jgi:site-specific recombinase XerD
MTTMDLVQQPAELLPVALPPDRNPAAVYLARLAPGSRRTMTAALEFIARTLTGDVVGHLALPWGALRYQHTQGVRSVLADRYSPATANKHLAALRGVLEEAWLLGQMPAEEYRRAAKLERVKGSRLPAGRELADTEVEKLAQACAAEPGPVGARDAAMLALLHSAGIRRAELVRLDLADFDQVAGSLRVLGKGSKERLVYVMNGARSALDAWLAVRGSEPGPLLLPVAKGGRIDPSRRLTDQAVYDRLEHLRELAGVARFSPHDLRRTFVSRLLDAGGDLASVQKLAGHSSPTTTARYDRREERAKRRTAAKIHFPYVAPGE